MGLGIGLLAIEMGVQWLSTCLRQWHMAGKSLLADRNSRTLFLSLKQDLNACGYKGFRHDAHYSIEGPKGVPGAVAVRGITLSALAAELDATWHARLLPGSDVLKISDIPVAYWAVEVHDPKVLQLKSSGSNELGLGHIKKEQRALLADAQGAAWLRVAAVDKIQKRVKLAEKINRVYGKEATFTPVEQVTYFVARSTRDSKQRYALWRQVQGENPEELLQGLEAFNVQYNVLESGICCLEKYRSAAQIADWSSICHMRVTWKDAEKSKPFSAEIGVGRVVR